MDTTLLANNSGGSRGGAWMACPPLFLDQTEARWAVKIFFGAPPPPYPKVWMTATPSPLSQGQDPALNNSQYCWMLHVVSICTPCCMLLCVVGSCYAKFEPSQAFEPTTPYIILFCSVIAKA